MSEWLNKIHKHRHKPSHLLSEEIRDQYYYRSNRIQDIALCTTV